MSRPSLPPSAVLLIVLIGIERAACPVAALEVTAWELFTGVQDFSGSASVQDFDVHTQVINPWQFSSLSQVPPSFSQANYEHAWVPDQALGTFNTTVTHAIYSPEVRTVSTSQIFILPDEDIRVTLSGSMSYAHTPGDWMSIDFGMSIRDLSANAFVFQESRRGGNLYLLPSASTLDIAGDVILSAGTTYRLSYTVDSSNTADLLPTGIFDATGFVNFSIAPVIPDPATALLLMTAAPLALRRRRR